MEEAIRAALLASSGVTALVPAARINWGEHPQGTGTPYITMMTVSDAEGLTMQGPDGLSQGRIQVDCYSPTYAQTKQVSRAVRAVLHGYRDARPWFLAGGKWRKSGAWDDTQDWDGDASLISGSVVRLVQHVGTRDSREGGTNEAERLFRCSLDFTTAWRN